MGKKRKGLFGGMFASREEYQKQHRAAVSRKSDSFGGDIEEESFYAGPSRPEDEDRIGSDWTVPQRPDSSEKQPERKDEFSEAFNAKYINDDNSTGNDSAKISLDLDEFNQDPLMSEATPKPEDIYGYGKQPEKAVEKQERAADAFPYTVPVENFASREQTQPEIKLPPVEESPRIQINQIRELPKVYGNIGLYFRIFGDSWSVDDLLRGDYRYWSFAELSALEYDVFFTNEDGTDGVRVEDQRIRAMVADAVMDQIAAFCAARDGVEEPAKKELPIEEEPLAEEPIVDPPIQQSSQQTQRQTPPSQARPRHRATTRPQQRTQSQQQPVIQIPPTSADQVARPQAQRQSQQRSTSQKPVNQQPTQAARSNQRRRRW